MRASPALRTNSRRRRSGDRISDPLSMAARYVRRARVSRQRGELERTLAAARSQNTGRFGTAAVTQALESDSVEHLLVTRRFAERQDAEARHLLHLATVRDLTTVVVDGVIGLELDLFGDGVASRLRGR